MRLRLLIGCFALALVGACSLNPQPFPPAPNDDRTGGLDADGSAADAQMPKGDAGSMQMDSGVDSGVDAEPEGGSDAGLDAPELDAETDALLSSD
jgi:hypothetical protein